MSFLANLHTADTEGIAVLVLVILGVVGLGAGVYLAFHDRIAAGVVCAVIGLVCLAVALG